MNRRAIAIGIALVTVVGLVIGWMWFGSKALDKLSPDEVHTAWITALRAQDMDTATALFTTEKHPYPGSPGYTGMVTDTVNYEMEYIAQLEKGWTSDDMFAGGPVNHVTILPVTPGQWSYLRAGRSEWWFDKEERGQSRCFDTVLLETPQGWKVASWTQVSCQPH